ncbi:MAG: hypothetical protein C3F13_03095 [Anaerolineales bacterium]|nr:MAG: hypothetical protein C3F13_03095 [Anaerolineales bacterium]
MTHRIFVCAVLVIIVLSANSPSVNPYLASAQSVAYQENFEDGQAQGWELESGWQVITDDANYVLAGQGHFWARSNQQFDDDYRLSFRLKLIKGTVHLVYRLNTAWRYFIGFSPDGAYLNKQLWPEVFYSDLDKYSANHTPNLWHQIEVIGQGNTVSFYVDGAEEMKYSDAEPLLGGSFAFETLDDSEVYVDDINVTLFSTPTIVPSQATEEIQSPSSEQLTWVWTGGPLGGLGYDIRMRPDDPDHLFVTDAWAGVFVSTDGGLSWFPTNQGITTRTGPTGDAIPVFSLTIDPINPDTMWVGTQFQRGIFKSTNGGESWQKMDNGVVEDEGITFRGFSVDPTNSDIVYAAAEISSWVWSSDRKQHMGREFDLTAGVIYKTINGGQSWKAVWRGDNLARYIWINPQDTDVLYISTGFFDREAANSDPDQGIPGGEGILKSTDGGQTWFSVNSGLRNLYITSLFMHPTNPDILLAATGNNQYHTGGGVYLTTDGGETWINTMNVSYDIFEAVEFSTSTPSIAYAGNPRAIYRSNNTGQTWHQVSSGQNWGPPGVCAGFPIDFQVDPQDPDRLFANEYGGGNFLSSDGGKTWVDMSRGYTGAQVRDVAILPSSSAGILAAARSGIFISHDAGFEWQGLGYEPVASMEWNVIAVDPNDRQHFLGATNWNGLAESHDGGTSWTVTAQITEDHQGWRAIAFVPSDQKLVYAGMGGFYSAGVFESSMPGAGIYRSEDGGSSWRPVNTALTQDAHVTMIAIDPSISSLIYAATTNHGLVKSSNGGKDWEQLRGGLPQSSPVLSVAIQPNHINELFVGLERGGIFKSEDGGVSWQKSAAGLNPEASVTDIVFDPITPTTIYLSDLLSGIYRSQDGGQTWEVINNGLNSRSVNSLAISIDGMHLYAAVEGNGVYRMDLNGQPPQPEVNNPAPLQTEDIFLTTLTPSLETIPSASPTDVYQIIPNDTPTVTTQAKPGICGSAIVIPIGLGLMIWQASRKRE